MRIPRIEKSNKVKDKNITIIQLEKDQIPKVNFLPDVDMDDQKSIDKYIKKLKPMIRGSMEYSDLMSMLKRYKGMNRCYYLRNIVKHKGDSVSIEAHHVGFTLTDIIETILRKRVANTEPYHYLAIAKEVMLCHYRGMIGITSLSATLHELIHAEDSKLFIPTQECDFGNPDLFYEEYKEYMAKDLKKKYETYKVLSDAVDKIEDIIPDYLNVNIIYYEHEGVTIPRMDKIMEILEEVA